MKSFGYFLCFLILNHWQNVVGQEVLCSNHEYNMALVHLKTCSIQEPREIQLKLLQGADFCKEVNELLLRCVTPIKSCFDFSTVTDVANALLHDVVPLNKPKLFANINQGKNCSVLAKQYAAKTAQPLLKSTVCNYVESWENRHFYETCKNRANAGMKLKLSQHRGHREILMKSVCATVDQLVECGRKLHQCLATSQVELINAALMDNLEKLLSSISHKTGFEASYCSAFSEQKFKRPYDVIMDRNDKRPVVRLASPSINVLDYSRSLGMEIKSCNSLLILTTTFISYIILRLN